LGSLLSLVIPRAYIGLFGIFAVGLGAKRLLDLARNHVETETSAKPRGGGGGFAKPATVAIVTLANGGDNIGVYTPAFAFRSVQQIVTLGLVFAVMTAFWCLFAHRLVNHPTLGNPVRRYGHRVAPIVLIGIGVFVMHEAGSFALLFHHGR
jgi:cadmium resistance protein CadD (predicted permease)